MPRARKTQSEPEPAGPRLVRKSAPKRPVEPVSSSPEVTHEQIALRAYDLFVEEGFTHGRHVDHWLRAERELMEITQARPATRVASTRAR